MSETQAKPDPGAFIERSTSEEKRLKLLTELPVSERKLHLADIRTSVLEGGGGQPLILLHGPGEYAAKWLRVIPEVVKTHRVVAPDLPGHGVSGVINDPNDPHHIIAWLDELIEKTCQTPPVLVGQILGGAIAARYATTYGDRIRGLVLADALGLAPFRPAPEFGAALMAFVAAPNGKTHDELWQYCAYDLDALRARLGPVWARIRAYNLDRAQASHLKATQQGLMEQFGFPGIPAAELARIKVPTTLIWGRHDLATSLAVAEAVSALHGWPLHVIEDAADDPPVEQPEAFLHALHSALARF